MFKPWARLFLLALLFSGVAQAEVGFPPWTQRAIDLTGTLEPAQIRALNEKLAAFEARKGSQIGVLMLPTTQPESIAQFGIRVFDSWKLGRKGVDDGVIVLVAKEDDFWRIEVGYGLEGCLTDATATRIARDLMYPYFTHGDYYGGIDAGVDAIIKVVEAEPLPPPKHTAVSQRNEGISGLNALLMDTSADVFSLSFMLILMLAVALGMMLNALLGNYLGRFSSALVVGGLLALGIWYIAANLLLAFMAAAILVFTTLLLKRSDAKSDMSIGD